MAEPAMKRRLISPASDASFEAPFAAHPRSSVTTLSDLPPEVVLLIGEHSCVKSVMHLGQTCKGFYYLLQPLAYKKDAQKEKRPLRAAMWACERDSLKVLRLSLDASCLMGLSGELHENLTCRGPALVKVCVKHKNDRITLLKELLSRGVELRHRDKVGDNFGLLPGLLHQARNPAMIAFLLALGYQGHINREVPKQKGTFWGTPLVSALRRSLGTEAIAMLLEAGADPTQDIAQRGTPRGSNVMAMALQQGHHGAARLLLARGVLLNPPNQAMPLLINGFGSFSHHFKHEARILDENLAKYIPLGLDINQECPILRMSRLHAALDDICIIEYLETLLKWGADPRRAYHYPMLRDPTHTVNAYQALLLVGGRRSLGREEEQATIQLCISKTRAMLAAEKAEAPAAPQGHKSLLHWAIRGLSLEKLEFAIHVLEPWLDKMQSDATVAAALQKHINKSGLSKESLVRRHCAIARIETYLRERRVPGFMKDYGAILRDRTKLKAP